MGASSSSSSFSSSSSSTYFKELHPKVKKQLQVTKPSINYRNFASNEDTYMEIEDFLVGRDKQLKSHSSSSLYLLNVINNIKEMASHNSLINNINNLKLNKYTQVSEMSVKKPSKSFSYKFSNSNYESQNNKLCDENNNSQFLNNKNHDDNNYILLTPDNRGLFKKSISFHNFKIESKKKFPKKIENKEKIFYCSCVQSDQLNCNLCCYCENMKNQSEGVEGLGRDLQQLTTRSPKSYLNKAYFTEKEETKNNQMFDINNNISKPHLNYNEKVSNNFSKTHREVTLNTKRVLPKVFDDSLSRKIVMQASTPELLNCLGVFLSSHFSHLREFDSAKAISWMRSVDRSLLLQGWQDVVFINPANLVFIYFLVNSEISKKSQKIFSIDNLQATLLACLYISYTYMGNEISYPSKPFLAQNLSKEDFWNLCLEIINFNSSNMLKLNREPSFFAQTFSELSSYCSTDL